MKPKWSGWRRELTVGGREYLRSQDGKTIARVDGNSLRFESHAHAWDNGGRELIVKRFGGRPQPNPPRRRRRSAARRRAARRVSRRVSRRLPSRSRRRVRRTALAAAPVRRRAARRVPRVLRRRRRIAAARSGGALRATRMGHVESIVYRDVAGARRRHHFPSKTVLACSADRKFLVIPAKTQEFVV